MTRPTFNPDPIDTDLTHPLDPADYVHAVTTSDPIAARDAHEDAEQARHLETPKTALDLAQDRTANFVKAIANGARAALVENRDEIDTLLTHLDKREAELINQIAMFGAHAGTVMARCVAIKTEIEEISVPFRPSTITQQR